MIYTTLNQIKAKYPCISGWNKLLVYLHKTEADNEPLSLLEILKSNGVDDCIWAFKCTDYNERIFRHIAADFAESVLHIHETEYPEDKKPRQAIQAARDFADGKITEEAMIFACNNAAWNMNNYPSVAAAQTGIDVPAAIASVANWAILSNRSNDGLDEKQNQYKILEKYLS